ncbi:MAG: HD domain-containing phosphohydrolase [Rubrivivax sp.]
MHLHSYWTDRALRRAPALAPLADAAGRVHERLDASGYHRGEGVTLPLPARLLAAADIYRACTEARPWRERWRRPRRRRCSKTRSRAAAYARVRRTRCWPRPGTRS